MPTLLVIMLVYIAFLFVCRLVSYSYDKGLLNGCYCHWRSTQGIRDKNFVHTMNLVHRREAGLHWDGDIYGPKAEIKNARMRALEGRTDLEYHSANNDLLSG